MRIGYAPGGCLRAYLEDLGYARAAMVSSGLIDAQGQDRLWRAITFPLAEAASIYGRHTDPGAGRHRFLARPKGGLYGWDRVRGCPTVIVVEGLFDLASLWQAGFSNAVASADRSPQNWFYFPRAAGQSVQVPAGSQSTP
jgi:DNA primase